jgi:hypothetical protein
MHRNVSSHNDFVPLHPQESGTTADDGGQTLRHRLRRAISLLRATRRERGGWAAVVLVYRLLLHKGPMLVRQIRAARRSRAVRADVQAVRAAAGRMPYLALVFTGGLGDLLVIARFVRDLYGAAGPFRFDLYCPTPHIAAWAMRRLPGFHAAYHDILFEHLAGEYDAALRVSQFVVAHRDLVRTDSLRPHPALAEVVETVERYRPRIETYISHHPWMDNSLARAAVGEGQTRRTYLHHIAGLRYGGDMLRVPYDRTAVARFGLAPRQYVTVHNGFDSGFPISGRRATKCYPHFGGVVARLKAALPHLTFVQVGSATSEPIAECDLSLVQRTSLDEVAGLLRQALLHLDNEGGLVHLARCLDTRSAVVFGPTPSDYFGYPGNINIDPPVCGDCWWLARTWMDRCVKGYPAPRCLAEQDPETVAERVLAVLRPAVRARDEVAD